MANDKRLFTDEQVTKMREMALINSKTQTIADALNIPYNTLKRRYGRRLTHWRAEGRTNSRTQLYKQRDTSPQVAIFIAKNDLGMVDKQDQTVRTEAIQHFTPEQLAQLKHLAGLADGINVHKPGNDKDISKEA